MDSLPSEPNRQPGNEKTDEDSFRHGRRNEPIDISRESGQLCIADRARRADDVAARRTRPVVQRVRRFRQHTRRSHWSRRPLRSGLSSVQLWLDQYARDVTPTRGIRVPIAIQTTGCGSVARARPRSRPSRFCSLRACPRAPLGRCHATTRDDARRRRPLERCAHIYNDRYRSEVHI